VGPFLVSLPLVWRIGISLHADTFGDSAKYSYALYSLALIVDVLLWMVIFPFEELFAQPTSRWRLLWMAIFAAVALGIIVVTSQHTHSLLQEVPAGSIPSGIDLLQRWMQKVTAVVFMFFITRVFAPLVVSHGARALRGAPPSEGQI
jgi:hypothetical protein